MESLPLLITVNIMWITDIICPVFKLLLVYKCQQYMFDLLNPSAVLHITWNMYKAGLSYSSFFIMLLTTTHLL